jgi:tetratricopeptide (TPR) repeat protein
MKTITFYSYKGGVGRSLALSNIAIRLSEFGKKVCVIDFDLDAPGLQFKFNNYDKGPIVKGLVDYIHLHSCDKGIPDNISDYSIDLKHKSQNFAPIKFIPAGNIEDVNYWKKLSMINWSDMFYSESGDGIDFFLDMKAKIEKEFKPDFLLIDSRTGITDISSITLKLLADEIVVLAANNDENMFGCKTVLKNLHDPNQSLFGKSPKVNFVLTRLPSGSTEDNEHKLSIVENRKAELMSYLNMENYDVNVIHSDPRLAIQESSLIGYEYVQGVSISNDYLKLFDILTRDELNSYDLLRFQNRKLAEREILRTQSEDILPSSKTKHFTKAIELDDTRIEYYISRANNYIILEEWDAAIKDFQHVLSLFPRFGNLDLVIGYCYYRKHDYDRALNYLNKTEDTEANVLRILVYEAMKDFEQSSRYINYVLLSDPNNHLVLNISAHKRRGSGDIQGAYKDIFRALELSPDTASYFATLAEIYASDDKIEEFYLNLSIALKLKIKMKDLMDTKDVYLRFVNEERFISLLAKYNLDAEDFNH